MNIIRAAALLAFAVATSFAQIPASVCNQQAAISLSSSGTTTVISSVGNQVIHICGIDFAAASAVSVKFVAVSAGGNTDLSGVYSTITSYSRDWQGTLTTKPGGAPASAVHFGINLSGAVAVGGTVTYYQTGQ